MKDSSDKSSFRTKLEAIKAILTSEHFLVITQKTSHSTTPAWGHKDWWAQAEKQFKQHKAKAKEMTDEKTSR